MNEFRLPMEYNWELTHKKIAKTEYYELDMNSIEKTVEVSTIKGIIEIYNVQGPGQPQYGFSSTNGFYINNPKLLLTEANRDNTYIQYSLYYKPVGDDYAVPYVMSSGFVPSNGVGFTLYNAAPDPGMGLGTNTWGGKFYMYYEIYTK